MTYGTASLDLGKIAVLLSCIFPIFMVALIVKDPIAVIHSEHGSGWWDVLIAAHAAMEGESDERVRENMFGPYKLVLDLARRIGDVKSDSKLEIDVKEYVEQFKPDLIVVACGYDACYFDPLSHTLLVANHFRVMTQKIMTAADELCGGRVVANHEGGYCDFYVPFCGVAVIETLAGVSCGVQDPYRGTEFVANQDLMPHQQTRINDVVNGPLQQLLRR